MGAQAVSLSPVMDSTVGMVTSWGSPATYTKSDWTGTDSSAG